MPASKAALVACIEVHFLLTLDSQIKLSALAANHVIGRACLSDGFSPKSEVTIFSGVNSGSASFIQRSN